MTSLNAQCASASAIVAKTVIDDAHWRAFGYKRRPRRRRIFQGLVSAFELERETTLIHELWAAGLGSIFRWALQHGEFLHRELFIAKLIEYSVDGLAEPLWPVLRFATRRDAIEFLRRACSAYSKVADSQQTRVFLQRCIDQMGQQIPKEWLVGTAWLFSHAHSLVFVTGSAMTQAGVADNPASDIEVSDQEFIVMTRKLFAEAAFRPGITPRSSQAAKSAAGSASR